MCNCCNEGARKVLRARVLEEEPGKACMCDVRACFVVAVDTS